MSLVSGMESICQNDFLKRYKIKIMVQAIRKVELNIIRKLWKGFALKQKLNAERKWACIRLAKWQ